MKTLPLSQVEHSVNAGCFFSYRKNRKQESRLLSMLLAKKMAKALGQVGVKVLDYEVSKDPRFIDGAVTLENALSVQVGSDYACLCLIEEEKINYLLEREDLTDEVGFATEVASFLKK